MASPCTGGTPSPPLGCAFTTAGVRLKRKSRFKFLPCTGFEPRTSQSNGPERDHSTTAHPDSFNLANVSFRCVIKFMART